MILVRVEFNPVHGQVLSDCGFDDHGDNWAVLCLIGPVPQANSLQIGLFLSTNSHNILVVCRQVHADDAVGMRVLECTDGNAVN